jgi:hypothetical protein
MRRAGSSRRGHDRHGPAALHQAFRAMAEAGTRAAMRARIASSAVSSSWTSGAQAAAA